MDRKIQIALDQSGGEEEKPHPTPETLANALNGLIENVQYLSRKIDNPSELITQNYFEDLITHSWTYLSQKNRNHYRQGFESIPSSLNALYDFVAQRNKNDAEKVIVDQIYEWNLKNTIKAIIREVRYIMDFMKVYE